MTTGKRPLSPHLQIYRPQITSVLSILHRMTGFALSIGVGVLVFWLAALSVGGGLLSELHYFFGTLLGNFVLLGFLFCFVYHFLNGVRHLFWDAGIGLEISSVNKSGWAIISATVLLTIGIWFCIGGF